MYWRHTHTRLCSRPWG